MHLPLTGVVALTLMVLCGCQHRHPQSQYSDAEAAAMAKRAEGLIPNGTTKTKKEVFAALNLNTNRITEHRIDGAMMVYYERGRLSDSYRISWMMAAQDLTPHESLRRKIYGLIIYPDKPK